MCNTQKCFVIEPT